MIENLTLIKEVINLHFILSKKSKGKRRNHRNILYVSLMIFRILCSKEIFLIGDEKYFIDQEKLKVGEF